MQAKRIWMALLLAAGGCDDLLTETPESFLAPENFYRTPADLEVAIGSIYSQMVPLLRGNFWTGLEAATDQVRNNPRATVPDILAMDALSYSPLNVVVTNPWQNMFTGINRANLLMENAARVDMDAAARDALIGEAKFMRALNYFFLVRLYGEVPLITQVQDPRSQTARTPTAEVYAQIIQDATEAARVLPLGRDGNNAGRATRGAALTLLADVQLRRGQWQAAADAAKQVMDLGVYNLFPDYLQAFLPANENGIEHVFSIQAEAPPAVGSNFVNLHFPREVGVGLGGGGGALQPTQWQFNSYAAGDYRRDVTYRINWTDVTGRAYNNLYPHVYKFRPTVITREGEGDVNWPVYRYAEVLLIHAEALNELNRGGEAVTLLNLVRARARRGTGNEARTQPANIDGPVGQAALREAIFMERTWELAHEGKRWFDLTRRGEQFFMSQMSAHEPLATDLEPTDMLWPVPQYERDRAPVLTQNPGY